MKSTGISVWRLVVAGAVAPVVLLAGDYKLFPENRQANLFPLSGWTTPAPLVSPATPKAPEVAAENRKTLPLTMAYCGVAGSTKNLRQATQGLVKAMVSGDEAAKIQALRSGGALADRLSGYVGRLRWQMQTATVTDLAAEEYERSIAEARDTLLTYDRLHDLAVGDIKADAKEKW